MKWRGPLAVGGLVSQNKKFDFIVQALKVWKTMETTEVVFKYQFKEYSAEDRMERHEDRLIDILG